VVTIAETAHRRRRDTRRLGIARRLGLVPTTQDVVEQWLDEALPAQGASALDAGCGRLSQLRPFRRRIGRFVGVDIHQPARPLQWLDEFRVADLCTDADAFPQGTFDLALSSFTVEHFADPLAAFRVIHDWLRPGAWLVVTTVNRGHPFVNAYLSLQTGLRGKAQRIIKASPADAHPLVGACNTPTELRAGLRDAGYTEVELVTTDHLARAWGRTLPTWALGLAGDLIAHSMPSRRSTIVARGRKPGTTEPNPAATSPAEAEPVPAMTVGS
jgi:SAM-dependent methyltransferase